MDRLVSARQVLQTQIEVKRQQSSWQTSDRVRNKQTETCKSEGVLQTSRWCCSWLASLIALL